MPPSQSSASRAYRHSATLRTTLSAVDGSRPVRSDVQLPDADVRARLNERALRHWTESSRRVARVAALVTSDVAAGLLGVLLVLTTWEIVSSGGRRPLPDDVPLLAMVFCLQPLALRVTGAYAGGRTRTDLVKIAGGIAIAALLGWVQARLFGREVPELPNKAAYAYSFVVITILAWGFRQLLDRVVRAGYAAGILQRRVLVVGSATEAEELSRHCRATPGCEFKVIGRLAASESDPLVTTLELATSSADVPYVGSVDDLERVLSLTGAHGLIVASNLAFDRMESLAGRCFRLGATISILPRALKQLSAAQIEVRRSPVGSLLQLRPVRLDVPQLAVKRSMDILLTLAAFAFVWPLFLLIAFAIKLDSRGPVFFAQIRAGVGGRAFRMLKFRTMREGADEEKPALASLNESGDSRLFKIRNDPRVTRVGRLLRRTSLDEIPQLLNVLRGEMSLVGPRPFFPGDLAHYERHHFERLHVLPGITGLWQVSGRSSVVDFEEVIRLDREYIENWSVLIDIRILFRTLPAALGRGAY
jgi:exopolysaccharide biosynthesis polyprenyl glycosylphosphotransferase